MWGKWAKNFGPVQAVYQGAADKIMLYATDASKIDPDYNEGGGYSVLGMLHYYAPYIPFVLTWPSNEEALSYFKKAHSIAPTISNKYTLALAFYKKGNKAKSIVLLNQVQLMNPRKGKLIEDRNGKSLAADFLKEIQS
jgi:tetratricopeptide (TPR) repeat protein